MYNEPKSGGNKIVFAIVAITIIGVIAAVIIAINNKAKETDATIKDQDESTQDIIDDVYDR